MVELDRRIVEWDVRRISDYSLETGLTGIACYAVSRRENKENTSNYISDGYIFDLIQALTNKQSKHKAIDLLIKSLNNILKKEKTVLSYNPVFEIVGKTKYKSNSIFELSRPLGISEQGYA